MLVMLPVVGVAVEVAVEVVVAVVEEEEEEKEGVAPLPVSREAWSKCLAWLGPRPPLPSPAR